ncbi:hypothetical protein [Pseudoalteromonas rhizosphaerae]|uniref:hypothetical protein n=1 Tax=Pseudoalteromonas rhizosphaerae TaxID=2518973 RepID=UPI003850C6D0
MKKLKGSSTPKKSKTKRQGIEPNTIAQIISPKSKCEAVLFFVGLYNFFYCTLSFKIQFEKLGDKSKEE